MKKYNVVLSPDAKESLDRILRESEATTAEDIRRVYEGFERLGKQPLKLGQTLPQPQVAGGMGYTFRARIGKTNVGIACIFHFDENERDIIVSVVRRPRLLM